MNGCEATGDLTGDASFSDQTFFGPTAMSQSASFVPRGGRRDE